MKQGMSNFLTCLKVAGWAAHFSFSCLLKPQCYETFLWLVGYLVTKGMIVTLQRGGGGEGCVRACVCGGGMGEVITIKRSSGVGRNALVGWMLLKTVGFCHRGPPLPLQTPHYNPSGTVPIQIQLKSHLHTRSLKSHITFFFCPFLTDIKSKQ